MQIFSGGDGGGGIIKRFHTLEFILSVQSQICSILNIAKLRKN